MCINVLHSNLWLPAQSGERPWRSETIGAAARKMSEKMCQTALSSWVFGAFWVYYKTDNLKLITKSGFLIFQKCSGPLGACF